jgi:hypothetical protein
MEVEIGRRYFLRDVFYSLRGVTALDVLRLFYTLAACGNYQLSFVHSWVYNYSIENQIRIKRPVS